MRWAQLYPAAHLTPPGLTHIILPRQREFERPNPRPSKTIPFRGGPGPFLIVCNPFCIFYYYYILLYLAVKPYCMRNIISDPFRLRDLAGLKKHTYASSLKVVI